MKSFNDLAIEAFVRSETRNFPVDGRLLDLGCGRRPYFDLYKDSVDASIAGDYFVRGPIDVQLDACNLPFPNCVFDIVLMCEVIEHISDLDRALSEVTRVLKPGGIFLVTWPFNYPMHEVPYDYNRLTEFGMALKLRETGMVMEALFRRGNAGIVALLMFSFFVDGFLSMLRRTPIVGRGFLALRWVVDTFIFSPIYRLYLLFSYKKGYGVVSGAGAGLDGRKAQLRLWTVGYCARVRKS